ncbi:hypothetical protein V6N11_008047 [Hibiscus sabdariffa]|uniref:Uncharacterized protein n=1 Tax=Hibiscus sabdariffa TaxID=183260 RepID=A0ABR2PZG6_9ROSI
MVDNCGNWGWSCLSTPLPQNLIARVAAILPHSTFFGQDLSHWRWEQNHCFSTKSTYSALDIDDYLERDFNWKSKTLLHVLRDCSMAQSV